MLCNKLKLQNSKGPVPKNLQKTMEIGCQGVDPTWKKENIANRVLKMQKIHLKKLLKNQPKNLMKKVKKQMNL